MGMERILKYYYTNNAAKLHDMVDKILSKFGGLSDKDMDDFYSLANEVFVDAMRRYHDGLSFDVFLYSCLQNRVKAEMTKRNREKRRADRMSIPIDMPFGDDEEVTLGDMIADSSDVAGGFGKRRGHKWNKPENRSIFGQAVKTSKENCQIVNGFL